MAALITVALLAAAGAAVWLLVIAPGLDPKITYEKIHAALKAEDEDALDSMVSDGLSRDSDDFGDEGLVGLLEAAGLSDAADLDVKREADRATVTYSSDLGETELRFARDGLRWMLDKVVVTARREVSVTVEAPQEYVDTEYLAQGQTVRKSAGAPGESVVVYEMRTVNGVAEQEEEVEEREVTPPVAEEWWRGVGDRSPYSSRLSGLRSGDSYNAETHKIEDGDDTLPLDAEMFAIGFHIEPVNASMQVYVVFLKPDGTFFEDVTFSPDPSWVYMNAVDYVDASQTDIMPGFWHAAIMIDNQPAGLVSFEIVE